MTPAASPPATAPTASSSAWPSTSPPAAPATASPAGSRSPRSASWPPAPPPPSARATGSPSWPTISPPRRGPPRPTASPAAGSPCGRSRSPPRWPSTPCTPATPPVRQPAWPPPTASRTTCRSVSRPRPGSWPESPPPDPPGGGGGPTPPPPPPSPPPPPASACPVPYHPPSRKEPAMNPNPQRPRLKVGSPASLLAVIPHLLGFPPERSLVVIGAAPPATRVQIAFRYDLPDPPDAQAAARIAAHAAAVLSRQHLTVAIVAGYGPGPLVTPVADAIRAAVRHLRVELHDVLRVEDGRYWSYICQNPSCCPAEGVPFDADAHPAAKAMAVAGLPVLASRTALAATIAPLTGPGAEAMAEATRRAERAGARLIAGAGPGGLDGPGLVAVRAAIQTYRDRG